MSNYPAYKREVWIIGKNEDDAHENSYLFDTYEEAARATKGVGGVQIFKVKVLDLQLKTINEVVGLMKNADAE